MLATLLATVALAAPFPQTIPVPPGSQPEGIATGNGNTFYVGSRLDGSVYRGDLRTGEGAVLVPGHQGERGAFGLKFRGGELYVAGGTFGTGYVYDAKTGEDIALLDFDGGFVNDVTVTRKAAFFTDSKKPFIYRYDRRTGATRSIPITGDFVYDPNPDAFNANGIAATPNGKKLILVSTGTGQLFTADPETGVTREIDIPAPVTNGDGILLRGKKLYVVRNQDEVVQVLRLRDHFTRGTDAGELTDPDFDIPTTIAAKGSRLYVVNARFSTPPTPTTPYDVVLVG